MPILQEVLRAKHKDEIKEVTDQTSRFSFKYECSCGIQGHFFTIEDAKSYQHLHRTRQGISNA